MRQVFAKKKEISIVLVLTLILGVFSTNIVKRREIKAAGTEYEVSVPHKDNDGVMTWDCVWFGNYWQNDTNGDGTADQNDEKEPIKWRVLSVDGDDVFLMADKVLDAMPFSTNYITEERTGEVGNKYTVDLHRATWEDSTLRTWLNHNFFNIAFNEQEQLAIIETDVENLPYNDSVSSGNDTIDKIYILSMAEAMKQDYGFYNDYGSHAARGRGAYATEYAKNNDIKLYSGSRPFYWLRTRTRNSLYDLTDYNAYVWNWSGDIQGSDLSSNEGYVYNKRMGVRPVLHLNLSTTSNWSYAGTVNANGEEISGIEKAKTVSAEGALYQSDGGMGSIKLCCDEKVFSENSYTYHHDLATFAAGMATMVYNETETNVQTALHNLGYLNVKYIPDSDGKKSPYWIAYKTVDLNGKETNIIGIFIRGTYKEEWIDNFDSGYGEKVHKGFYNAADDIYKGLCDYIVENDFAESQMKILVTGHSRGAAAANLLGYKLDRDGLSGVNVTSRDIFVYTFATPNTTAMNDKNSSEYYNIYNIVNPEDFVTKVMPSKWGYGRYGQTFVLPSSSTETVIPVGNYVRYYSEYLPELKKLYKQYRPDDKDGYAPYMEGMKAVYGYVKLITSIVPDAEKYYTKNLTRYPINTKDKNILTSLQKLFTYTLGYFKSETSPYKEISTTAIAAAIGGSWGKIGQMTITFFGMHELVGKLPVISPAFSCAHRAETYLAAMNVLSEKQLRQKRSYFWGTVNCPVDVTIKDGNGNVIGKIVDNTVDEEIEEGIQMDVEGDSKTFTLPQDASYTVELTGNDDGVMDYSLSVMDADSGESERTFYQAVPIKKGQTMTQSILEESDLTDIKLLNEDSQVIGKTNYFQSDDLGQLSVEVEVEGIGSANGAYNVTAGDYVILSAIVDENNSFLGWYDEKGQLLSTEMNYGISVNENISLKAKFTDVVVDSTDIIFDKEEVKMIVGDIDINSATILPSNATNKNIMYSSSDEKVVTVGDYGLLTAIGKGTATITAVSEDGKAVANLKVTVSETTDDPSDVISTETGKPNPTPKPTAKPVKKTTPNFSYGNTTSQKTKKPGKVTGVYLFAKKGGKMEIEWSNLYSNTVGYQIQYAQNKGFSKKKKTKNVSGYLNWHKTIKGLKKGKIYYVRVRAYNKKSGRKVYGKWSKVKKVKI